MGRRGPITWSIALVCLLVALLFVPTDTGISVASVANPEWK